MRGHDIGPVRAVIFDFGGVVAEEGFKEGLRAIAARNSLDPSDFLSLAESLVYSTGYVVGRYDESSFWRVLREKTGISGSDGALREEVLTRFVLRPEMLSCVRGLRRRGVRVAVLSDQTNWLVEVDRKTGFSRVFDGVFNSYTLGISKRDPKIFSRVCEMIGVQPGEALFVDDNEGNVLRAAAEGLQAIHFLSFEDFHRRLTEHGLEGC